jgi:hypothetical protein
MSEHEFSIGLTSEWFTPAGIFQALALEFALDPAHPGRDKSLLRGARASDLHRRR